MRAAPSGRSRSRPIQLRCPRGQRCGPGCTRRTAPQGARRRAPRRRSTRRAITPATAPRHPHRSARRSRRRARSCACATTWAIPCRSHRRVSCPGPTRRPRGGFRRRTDSSRQRRGRPLPARRCLLRWRPPCRLRPFEGGSARTVASSAASQAVRGSGRTLLLIARPSRRRLRPAAGPPALLQPSLTGRGRSRGRPRPSCQRRSRGRHRRTRQHASRNLKLGSCHARSIRRYREIQDTCPAYSCTCRSCS